MVCLYFFFQSFFMSRFSLMMEFEVPKFSNKSMILCAMPSLMVLFNYFGLVPFSMPLSAHMEFFMIFSFMVVLTIVMSNFFFNPYNFFIHFMPFSCPLVLSVFLFLIEVMSLFMRPMTLALRLGANITSGHMMLGMTMSTIVLTPFFYFFEVFVCLMQSYMFVTLVSVYSQEHSV